MRRALTILACLAFACSSVGCAPSAKPGKKKKPASSADKEKTPAKSGGKEGLPPGVDPTKPLNPTNPVKPPGAGF